MEKFQVYVKVLDAGAQLLTIAVGEIATEGPVKQRGGILLITTVGCCFIITVCGSDVTAPQELVVVNVIE